MTQVRSHADQHGAALLTAMLTVALIATLAAGAIWQQWRLTEVEGIERHRAQARWLLTGALDWARVVLREDARASAATGNLPIDHLGEPWAVPLQEVRLSSFLTALPQDGSSSDDLALADQVLLSGRINDLQGRLNVTNLLQGKELDRVSLAAFSRLFYVLGLPITQLNTLTQGLQAAQQQQPGAPPMPQRVAQLAWLGVLPDTLAVLSPYITVLPNRTPVNVNTAPYQVLYAALPELSLAKAQELVQTRSRSPWADVESFGKTANHNGSDNLSVNTEFFEVIGQLRMRDVLVLERSVVLRQGDDARILWREFGPWSRWPLKAEAASLQ